MKPVSGNKIIAIGIMSGTSLDGLDLAAVEFRKKNEKWSFQIMEVTTYAYSPNWTQRLLNAPSLSGEELTILHVDYGKLIAEKTNIFIQQRGIKPDLIASHGHTVFHQPEKGFTLQIGSGADIAINTGITTIADFRTLDVALGGQGAPLVPIGDKLLFSEYKYCLNLGGFSNVSFEQDSKRIAFDICPVNFVINYFAAKQGLTFDTNGEMGRQGHVNQALLDKLNSINYYNQNPPKSLGREWMEDVFFPIVHAAKITANDKLRTVYEHIAIQIARIGNGDKMLITGGGAYNSFLLERINHHSNLEIVLPEKNIIDFKEALIFAFLGTLKIKNEINCYSSVTGASRDSCVGIIFDDYRPIS